MYRKKARTTQQHFMVGNIRGCGLNAVLGRDNKRMN